MVVPEITAALHYIGSKFVDNPKSGDVVTQGEDTFVFNGKYWDEIGKSSDLTTPQPKKITYPTNCKNCGAIMKSCTCEYCGTTYTGYEEPKYDDKLITAAALSLAKQNNDPLYDKCIDSYHKKKYIMNCLKYL